MYYIFTSNFYLFYQIDWLCNLVWVIYNQMYFISFCFILLFHSISYETISYVLHNTSYYYSITCLLFLNSIQCFVCHFWISLFTHKHLSCHSLTTVFLHKSQIMSYISFKPLSSITSHTHKLWISFIHQCSKSSPPYLKVVHYLSQAHPNRYEKAALHIKNSKSSGI